MLTNKYDFDDGKIECSVAKNVAKCLSCCQM